jgi:predicted dehydrogenase
MKLRSLMVGFGFIAQGHLTAYAESSQAQVGGVFDTSEARRRLAESMGLRTFGDLDEALEQVGPDFIDICTPPSSHEDYMGKALDRGLDALCEKPLFVTDSAGEQRLLEQSLAGPHFVFPVHNYRHAPVFKRLNRIMAQNPQRPRFGSIQIYRTGHARGVADWQPDWRRDPALSLGGIVMDHGPHTIYIAEMLNQAHVTAVAALVHEDACHPGSESAADLRLGFSSGAEMQVVLTWEAGSRESHYRLVHDQGFMTIHDDELTISVQGRETSENVASLFNDAAHGQWFTGVLNEFVTARDDSDLRTSRLREARRVCRCIRAAYRSARNGGSWEPVET